MVPVRCDGPCDVRATPAAAHSDAVVAVGSLRGAGQLRLRLHPFGSPLAPPQARHVTVTLRAGAPGARTTVTRRVVVPVTVGRSPPVPALLDVRARRDGKDLVVTWRTASAARDVGFSVAAFGAAQAPLATAFRSGGAALAYRVRMRGAARARKVILTAFGGFDRTPRQTTVRVS